jgi:hypothetical protein
MRLRLLLPLLAAASLAAAAAQGAAGATAPPARPVLLGFEDEASFLWSSARFANLDRAAVARARVIRVTADWAQLAPRRPASPTSPRDSAYRFNGLDDLIWQAELRGMQVLLTIWGTPRWATASHKPNAAPRPADLGAFCNALGARYNGRAGFPQVSYFTVWNEPNLDQFLHPQFSASGADVAPRLYAGMARACVTGLKRANPHALVALGETSPRGHDRPVSGSQASHSPGRFMELVGAVRPRVPFDAWAHHPYPDGFVGSPTSHFRWPNVGIADLATLEAALRRSFGRHVPLWVTEFGYQTRPERPGALTYARQASYLTRAVQAALALRDVSMFVWYVFRDTPAQRWQSGLVTAGGAAKPSLRAFTTLAQRYDVGNPTLSIPPTEDPKVSFAVLELRPFVLPDDPPLGVEYRVLDQHGTLVANGQPQARFDPLGRLTVTLLFTPKPHAAYTVSFDVNDVHGNRIRRTAHLLVK